MKELIERKAALDLLCHYCKQPCDHVLNCAQWYAINSLDAEPVKHGRWIEQEAGNLDTYYTCSACKEDFCLIEGEPSDNLWNYCPNCGAKMDEFKTDI